MDTTTLAPQLVKVDRIDKRTKEGKNYDELIARFSNSHSVELYKKGEYSWFARLSLNSDTYGINIENIQRYVGIENTCVDVPLNVVVDLYSKRCINGSTIIQFHKDEEPTQHEVDYGYSIDGSFVKTFDFIAHKLESHDKKQILLETRDSAIAAALTQPLDELSVYKLQNAKRVLNKLQDLQTSITIATENEWAMREYIKKAQTIHAKTVTAGMLKYFIETLENDVHMITETQARRYTFGEVFHLSITRYGTVLTSEHGNQVLETFLNAVEWGF